MTCNCTKMLVWGELLGAASVVFPALLGWVFAKWRMQRLKKRGEMERNGVDDDGGTY